MQGLPDMSPSLGQKRTPGRACAAIFVACRCYSWKECEVDTHHSCFTEPLVLLQPEGHVVKVSLHTVVFIMITRTSVEDWR